MTISDKVKGLLAMNGIKQGDLETVLGLSSKQAVSNKIRYNRWFASDLLKIANLCGCQLAFVLPNGEMIYIQDDTETKIPRMNNSSGDGE